MRSTGAIRSFVAADIAAVAALHRRAFPNSSGAGIERDLRDVFLENPWAELGLASLVYDAGGDGIVGFLGVMPRRMTCGGRSIRAATSTQFMVDPARRGTVAVQLLSRFLDGPQDVSLADEGSDVSRRLWTALGGEVALLQSLRWTKILRPFRFAASLTGETGMARTLQGVAGPICAVCDALIGRMPRSPFGAPRPWSAEGPFTPAAFLALLRSTAGPLAPAYDESSLGWLLDRLERKRCFGRLHKHIVYGEAARPVGGYLCYVRPTKTAEVACLAAEPGCFEPVWTALVSDAWKGGASALSGRLDPRYVNDLSDRRCVFNRGFGAVLFQTKHRDIRDAIHSGRVILSRLDGEWWMRFIGEPNGILDRPGAHGSRPRVDTPHQDEVRAGR